MVILVQINQKLFFVFCQISQYNLSDKKCTHIVSLLKKVRLLFSKDFSLYSFFIRLCCRTDSFVCLGMCRTCCNGSGFRTTNKSYFWADHWRNRSPDLNLEAQAVQLEFVGWLPSKLWSDRSPETEQFNEHFVRCLFIERQSFKPVTHYKFFGGFSRFRIIL